MTGDNPPIVILGGSDGRAAELPPDGRDKHPLAGYKGVDVLIQGRPLVDTIIDRLEASACFGPVFIAGPARVYGERRGHATTIDTDGTFAENIEVAVDRLQQLLPGAPIAITTCDILPDESCLRSVMEDYRRSRPCDMWFPVIKAPGDARLLGPSGWKPTYRIVPEAGRPADRILPGHLAVVDPAALRLDFLYRLFQLGYRTRNRPIAARRAVMVRGVLAELLSQDLRDLVRLRAPTLTWNVLGAGLSAARELKSGTITRRRLEDALRRIFVRRRWRRRYPQRRVHAPALDGLSLALDIDTEEEAAALGGEVSGTSSRA